MLIPIKIVAIFSDCALFQLTSLFLAQTICISVAIVEFGADYSHFRWAVHYSVEIVVIGADYSHFSWAVHYSVEILVICSDYMHFR